MAPKSSAMNVPYLRTVICENQGIGHHIQLHAEETCPTAGAATDARLAAHAAGVRVQAYERVEPNSTFGHASLMTQLERSMRPPGIPGLIEVLELANAPIQGHPVSQLDGVCENEHAAWFQNPGHFLGRLPSDLWRKLMKQVDGQHLRGADIFQSHSQH